VPSPRQLIPPSNITSSLFSGLNFNYVVGVKNTSCMNDTQICCPHCTQLLSLIPQLAGQQVTCPACQKVLTMPLTPVRPNGESPLPARYANMRRERSPKTRWVILYLVVIVGGTLFCAFAEMAIQLF
jgi:hypothetical protein